MFILKFALSLKYPVKNGKCLVHCLVQTADDSSLKQKKKKKKKIMLNKL